MTVAPVRDQALSRTFARLRAVRRDDADAVERSLHDVLQPVAASAWPEVAWRSGVLTATGFPVELAWASRDAALRATCEVAGPETAEKDRLAVAASLSGVDVGAWTAVQRQGSLRWGAWLGLRQLDTVRRTKVYLELPAGVVPPGPWSAASARLARRAAGLSWRMAGVSDDGSVELYARVPELTWTTLAAADGRLPGPVAALTGRVLARPSGLSLVLAPSGEQLAVTWFAIAKTMWGSDNRARAAVLAAADRIGCSPASRAVYEALASGPDDGRWRHGMIGAGVDRAGGTWLQAGLRPT